MSAGRVGWYPRAVAISVLIAAAVLCFFVYRVSHRADLIAAQFQLDTGPQATLIYDRTGQLLFSFHEEERTDRRLSELAPSLVPAVLSAEDKHFRSHAGVDLVRMAGAAVNDVKTGRLAQGASTITQQLVRSQALGRERTWSRKWREILLAMRIERRFTKDEILETYLNRIYLGDGYFGMQAAARGYFDKDASALDVAESALLAGIIRCPSACSPRTQPERARRRRDVVLKTMRDAGQVPEEAYTTALAEQPTIAAKPDEGLVSLHPNGGEFSGMYFIDAVRRDLTSRFGEGAVLRGGLRVYTTLDPHLQKAAEDAITRRLATLDAQDKTLGHAGSENPIQASLVAIDPRTGDVLALVGGRDFHESPFNRAIQSQRQPGSAFKPIIYAAALEGGLLPSSLLDRLDDPIESTTGGWLPADEHEATTSTLRQALVVSSNRAAARLLQQVGIDSAQYYARRLGLTSPMPSIPSLALGTAEVSPIELTSAYGVFAANGMLATRHLIARVEDGAGDVLWRAPQTSVQVLRPATAFLMSSMLADVVTRGTGSQARSQGFKLPAAGKTGTTSDSVDAWFIGYTPNLVAGVWFGRDQPAEILRHATAATIAVPAWSQFMQQATAGDRTSWYQDPADFEKAPICQASGMRATTACRLAAANHQNVVVEDYFPKGTSPKEPCSIHVEQLALPGVVDRPSDQPVVTVGVVPVAPGLPTQLPRN